MRAAMEAARARERGECAGNADGNANMWADRKKSQRQFGYDAEAEALRWCEENGYGVVASGGRKRRSWIVGAATKGFFRVVCQM
jgi:salicylate hydroxylase